MRCDKIHLKELYPFLDNNCADPVLEIMIQEDIMPEKKRPSILVCPGGGYGMTSDREAQNIGIEYMTMGLNAFILRYSVKTHKFPQQLLEVACAIDYIAEHSAEWNGDSSKIAIIGFSAGGHLVASYCTMRNYKEVTDIIPSPKSVQAAILCYPVITAEEPTHLDSFRVLTGKTDIDTDDIEKLSAEKHVSKDLTPPTFIWTTADDNIVDSSNTIKYAAALQKEGVPFELHIFPTGYHGLSTCRYGIVNDTKHPMCEYINVWTEMTKKWLRKVLGL